MAPSLPGVDDETSDGDLSERLDATLTASRSSRWHASAARWQVAREVAAIDYLHANLGVDRFLPPIGGWTIDYTVAAAVLDIVKHQNRAVHMLELGSGSGTPWFATMVAQVGGSLVTVEHDPEYVRRTQALVDHYGLRGTCSVVHAPLIPGEDGALWYDPAPILSAVQDRGVDVLIVDGPPASSGPAARRPALHHVSPLLSSDALVVLDDVARQDEQLVLAEWQSTFGDRLHLLPLVDRASIFRLSAAETERA